MRASLPDRALPPAALTSHISWLHEKFFRMDLTHCTASRSPFDYFNNEERVAIELKSRSCSKATYATTILPSEKVHRLLRMAREGWRVFAAFALDDCIGILHIRNRLLQFIIENLLQSINPLHVSSTG